MTKVSRLTVYEIIPTPNPSNNLPMNKNDESCKSSEKISKLKRETDKSPRSFKESNDHLLLQMICITIQLH